MIVDEHDADRLASHARSLARRPSRREGPRGRVRAATPVAGFPAATHVARAIAARHLAGHGRHTHRQEDDPTPDDAGDAGRRCPPRRPHAPAAAARSARQPSAPPPCPRRTRRRRLPGLGAAGEPSPPARGSSVGVGPRPHVRHLRPRVVAVPRARRPGGRREPAPDADHADDRVAGPGPLRRRRPPRPIRGRCSWSASSSRRRSGSRALASVDRGRPAVARRAGGHRRHGPAASSAASRAPSRCGCSSSSPRSASCCSRPSAAGHRAPGRPPPPPARPRR